MKGASSLRPDPDPGSAGRWWVVALLVLLVLALLGAIFLSMEDPELAASPPTRSTLSIRPLPAEPPTAVVGSSGHLRFDGAHAGATLEIDGTSQGTLSPGSMVVDVAPGVHSVRVLRDGELVASAEVSVEAGRHEFVELVDEEPTVAPPEPSGVEPPPEPSGLEPPPEMAALPQVDPTSARRMPELRPPAGGSPARAEEPEEPQEPGYARRTGDLPHEPTPRPTP